MLHTWTKWLVSHVWQLTIPRYFQRALSLHTALSTCYIMDRWSLDVSQHCQTHQKLVFRGKLYSSTTCFPSCVHSLIRENDLSLSGIKTGLFTSSNTSLTAAPQGSSSGSIPPPGTIHWSGCRLLLTSNTYKGKHKFKNCSTCQVLHFTESNGVH